MSKHNHVKQRNKLIVYFLEINECKRNHECEHNCIDKPRYYECSCRPGYELGSNNKSCHGKCDHS